METSGVVHLKAKEEHRILNGHLWVFSNEIQRVEGNPAQGTFIELKSAQNQFLGIASWNKHSLLAARILSRHPIEDLNAFIRRQVMDSNARRKALGFEGVYRMVFGESDGLPGIVIDRYEDTCVVESFSSGGDSLLPIVVETLIQDIGIENVFERSESIWRTYEQLERRSQVLHGSAPVVDVKIDGLRYAIDVREGQKTGLFLDQRDNRRFVESVSNGKSVIDLFCNDGGFSLHAARGGAREVTAVDISQTAVERARANVSANELSQVTVVCADVFDFMIYRTESDRSADLVIVDPPSFIKNKKSIASGIKGYRKLNEAALSLVNEGGMIVSCSCSQHMTEEMFLTMLQDAARRARKNVSIIRISGASSDHPILLPMPETRYLTCVAGFVQAL